VTGAVVLVGALAVAIAPRPVFTSFNHAVVLVTCLVVLALAVVARVPRIVRPFVNSRWTAPLAAVVGGALGTVVGEVMRYPYGWDAREVMTIARHVHAGIPMTAGEAHYLSTYPNNLPLIAIDRLGADLASRTGLSPDAVLIVANGICLAASLWLVHVVVRRAAGRGPALLAMLLTWVFVGLSPWMAVPYTDLYAMPFVIGAVALAGSAMSGTAGWPRWVAWAGAVACAAVGFVIKTTPVVLIVAGPLVVLLRMLPEPERHTPTGPTGATRPSAGERRAGRRVAVAGLVAAATLAGFLAVSAGLTTASREASGVDLDRVHTSESAPILWWVANGMNEVEQPTFISYGGFNRAQVNAINGRSPAQMKQYARDYISGQWAERGLGGMASFYANKAVWNWSDATFSAWSEGYDAQTEPIADTAASRWLTAVNGYEGTHYELRVSITQGIWVALLLIIGVGLLRVPFRRDVLLLALTMVGIVAFNLVFQGRSRYLLAFVPVIVALGCATLPWLPRPIRFSRPVR
jgi:hypothetical protein